MTNTTGFGKKSVRPLWSNFAEDPLKSSWSTSNTAVIWNLRRNLTTTFLEAFSNQWWLGTAMNLTASLTGCSKKKGSNPKLKTWWHSWITKLLCPAPLLSLETTRHSSLLRKGKSLKPNLALRWFRTTTTICTITDVRQRNPQPQLTEWSPVITSLQMRLSTTSLKRERIQVSKTHPCTVQAAQTGCSKMLWCKATSLEWRPTTQKWLDSES